MKYIFFFLFVFEASSIFGQDQVLVPKDFLPKEFHNDRRTRLREKLPANSVAVFFANAVRNRANDVDYLFHQDPTFYYLTGYSEPHAVLFIFKDLQTANDGTRYDEIIFVQPRDVTAEMWNGRRLGDAGVKSRLGIEQAFNNTEFKKYTVDFKSFDQILFADFENDVRDEKYDSADLFDIIQQFKTKVGYPSEEGGLTLDREPQKNNLNTKDLNSIISSLRGIKTKEEIELIRKAVKISTAGQVEVMKAIKPGMSEREIQGIHEYVFKKYQAEDLGYPSIVGAGHNGCILHYRKTTNPISAQKNSFSWISVRNTEVIPQISPEPFLFPENFLMNKNKSMNWCSKPRRRR